MTDWYDTLGDDEDDDAPQARDWYSTLGDDEDDAPASRPDPSHMLRAPRIPFQPPAPPAPRRPLPAAAPADVTARPTRRTRNRSQFEPLSDLAQSRAVPITEATRDAYDVAGAQTLPPVRVEGQRPTIRERVRAKPEAFAADPNYREPPVTADAVAKTLFRPPEPALPRYRQEELARAAAQAEAVAADPRRDPGTREAARIAAENTRVASRALRENDDFTNRAVDELTLNLVDRDRMRSAATAQQVVAPQLESVGITSEADPDRPVSFTRPFDPKLDLAAPALGFAGGALLYGAPLRGAGLRLARRAATEDGVSSLTRALGQAGTRVLQPLQTDRAASLGTRTATRLQRGAVEGQIQGVASDIGRATAEGQPVLPTVATNLVAGGVLGAGLEAGVGALSDLARIGRARLRASRQVSQQAPVAGGRFGPDPLTQALLPPPPAPARPAPAPLPPRPAVPDPRQLLDDDAASETLGLSPELRQQLRDQLPPDGARAAVAMAPMADDDESNDWAGAAVAAGTLGAGRGGRRPKWFANIELQSSASPVMRDFGSAGRDVRAEAMHAAAQYIVKPIARAFGLDDRISISDGLGSWRNNDDPRSVADGVALSFAPDASPDAVRRTLAAVSQTLDQEAAFYARPVADDDPARTAYGVRLKLGTLSPSRYQELLGRMEEGRTGWSGTTRVGRGDLHVVFDPDTPPEVSFAEGERLQQVAESLLGRTVPGDYYPTESALITRDQYASHLADVRGHRSGAARALRSAQEFYPNIIRAVSDDLAGRRAVERFAGPRTLESVSAAVKDEKTGRIVEGLSHSAARGSFGQRRQSALVDGFMVARPGSAPEFVTRAEASALFDQLGSKRERRAAELSAGRGSQVTSEDLSWATRGRHGFAAGAAGTAGALAEDPDTADASNLPAAAALAAGALAARDVPMFSRLFRAVLALPKKWDNALPARQWIDFMARPNSPFKEAEVALVRPELERAAAEKRTLTKADVLGLVGERGVSVTSSRLTPDAEPVADAAGVNTTGGGRLVEEVNPGNTSGWDDEDGEYWRENIAPSWFRARTEADIRDVAERRIKAVADASAGYQRMMIEDAQRRYDRATEGMRGIAKELKVPDEGLFGAVMDASEFGEFDSRAFADLIRPIVEDALAYDRIALPDPTPPGPESADQFLDASDPLFVPGGLNMRMGFGDVVQSRWQYFLRRKDDPRNPISARMRDMLAQPAIFVTVPRPDSEGWIVVHEGFPTDIRGWGDTPDEAYFDFLERRVDFEESVNENLVDLQNWADDLATLDEEISRYEAEAESLRDDWFAGEGPDLVVNQLLDRWRAAQQGPTAKMYGDLPADGKSQYPGYQRVPGESRYREIVLQWNRPRSDTRTFTPTHYSQFDDYVAHLRVGSRTYHPGEADIEADVRARVPDTIARAEQARAASIEAMHELEEIQQAHPTLATEGLSVLSQRTRARVEQLRDVFEHNDRVAQELLTEIQRVRESLLGEGGGERVTTAQEIQSDLASAIARARFDATGGEEFQPDFDQILNEHLQGAQQRRRLAARVRRQRDVLRQIELDPAQTINGRAYDWRALVDSFDDVEDAAVDDAVRSLRWEARNAERPVDISDLARRAGADLTPTVRHHDLFATKYAVRHKLVERVRADPDLLTRLEAVQAPESADPMDVPEYRDIASAIPPEEFTVPLSVDHWQQLVVETRAELGSLRPPKDDTTLKAEAQERVAQGMPWQDEESIYTLATARLVREAVAEDADRIAWPTADNRARVAGLRKEKSERIYHMHVKGAITRLLRGAGVTAHIQEIRMNGESWLSTRLTEEDKAKLRAHGVPMLAAAALPLGEREADDDAYDTAIAGLGAMGALQFVRTNRLRVRMRQATRLLQAAIHERGLNTAALGAAAGALQLVPDEEWQATGVGVAAAALLHAASAPTLRATAGRSLTRSLRAAATDSPRLRQILQFVSPRTLLSAEAREALDAADRTTTFGRARGAELAQRASARGGVVDRAIGEAVDQETNRAMPLLSAADQAYALQVAGDIAQEMDTMGRRKVGSGVLAANRLIPNYLRRTYAYWNAIEAGFAPPPSRSGARRLTPERARTLGTDPAAMQAREGLGEFREASIRTGQGMAAGWRNVAMAELFTRLRVLPGTVNPEFAAAADQLAIAQQLRQQAPASAQAQMADVVERAQAEVRRVRDRFRREREGWVALPDDANYGAMRGAVVRPEIASELRGYGDDHLFDGFMRLWRKMKTIYNPGTHFGNVASNIVMSLMAGVEVTRLPAAMRTLAEYREGRAAPDSPARLLAEAGVIGSSALAEGVVSGDRVSGRALRRIGREAEPSARAVLEQQGVMPTTRAGRIARGVQDAVSDLDDRMVRLYANEDDWFRVAAFETRRAQGASDDEAIRFARESLVDFSGTTPLVRVLRRGLLPFVVYPAKALPTLAGHIAEHPWRWILLTGALGAANELSEAVVGEVDERDLAPPQRRSPFGYLMPGNVQLPMREADGSKFLFDASRWFPTSALTTPAPPGTMVGERLENAPGLVQGSGPLLDVAAKLYANRDPFTGDDYVPDYMTPGEQAGQLARALGETMLPPVLAFHRERLTRDWQKRDRKALGTDALGLVGLRPRVVRPGGFAQDAAYDANRAMLGARRAFQRAVRGSQNPAYDSTQVEKGLRRADAIQQRYLRRTGVPLTDSLP